MLYCVTVENKNHKWQRRENHGQYDWHSLHHVPFNSNDINEAKKTMRWKYLALESEVETIVLYDVHLKQ